MELTNEYMPWDRACALTERISPRIRHTFHLGHDAVEGRGKACHSIVPHSMW